MKNRIAKLVGIRKVEIFEEELPPLKEDEVIVAISSVGICGSDMHYFLEGGLGTFKQPLPMHIGHEPAGVVVDSFGPIGFEKGERVVIEPGLACGYCEWCLKGRHNLCVSGQFMGATSPGGIADYVIVDKRQLFKLPDSMSDNMGALLEPLGVGLHTINLTMPKATDSATIFGAGPIGLCLLAVLQKFGLKEIYVVDTLPYKVKLAKKMGATNAFLYKDAVNEIKRITNKKGTSFAYDTVGKNESIAGCIDSVSTAGTIGLVGIPTEDFITYNPHKLRTKEVTLQNVRRSNQTLEDCIKLFSDDTKIERIVTHEFNLTDTQKAFDLVANYSDNVVKCVIKPDQAN